MTFIIPGPIPSKKNSRINIVRKGKILNFPNNKYQSWHKEAVVYLRAQLVKMTPEEVQSLKAAEKVTATIIKFYWDNRIRRDMTNVAESVMDLLVDCKILKDDNWRVVPSLILESMGVDKQNPRAEVILNIEWRKKK